MSSTSRTKAALSFPLGYGARVLTTCLLLGLVLYLIDFETALGQARSANPWLLVLAVAILLCRAPFMLLRWQAILLRLGGRLDWRHGIYVVLISAFFGQFSPSGIGNDVSRGILAAGGNDPAAIVASLFADRIFGLVSSILLAAPPALIVVLSGGAFLPSALAWFVLVLLAAIVVLWVLLGRTERQDRQQAVSMSRAKRFLNLSRESMRMCLSAIGDFRLAAVALGWSLVIQAMAIASVVVAGLALGIDVPIWAYFLLVPIVWLATSVPVSLGGIGVREVSLVALLPGFGADATEALTFGVLLSVVSIIAAVVGALLAKLARPMLLPAAR